MTLKKTTEIELFYEKASRTVLQKSKMFALTSEFIIGLLIGIILGYSFYYKIHKDQLHIINQKIDELINLVEPKKKPKSSKQIGQRNYPPEIENLWNDLALLYEKRIKSDSKFSFNKMVFEICKLLSEGKSIAVSTIRSFYLRRMTKLKMKT